MVSRYLYQVLPLLVSLLIVGYESKHFHSFAGPFRFVLRRFQNCDPKKTDFDPQFTMFAHEVRTSWKDSSTYTGNTTFPFYLSDTLGGKVTFASWNRVSGWRENAFIIAVQNNVCQYLEKGVKQAWETAQVAVFGEKVPCPWYPGVYHFKNWTIDPNNVLIKEFFYGRWRAEAKIMKGSRPLTCAQLLLDSVPK